MDFVMNQDRLEPDAQGAGYGWVEGSGREGKWLSLLLSASISQLGAAAKNHELKPRRESRRRGRRSGGDVCTGVH